MLDLILGKTDGPFCQRGRGAHFKLLDLILGKNDDSSWAIILLREAHTKLLDLTLEKASDPSQAIILV